MDLQTLANAYDEASTFASRRDALRQIIEWMIGQTETTVTTDIAALTNPQATKDYLSRIVTVNGTILFSFGA